MLWFIFVSSHPPTHLRAQCFLNRAGDWPMFHGEFEDFEFLRRQIDLLRGLTDGVVE